MNRVFILVCLLFNLSFSVQSSNGTETIDLSIEKGIDDERIEELSFLILSEISDQQKDSISTLLKIVLSEELSKRSAFSHSFEKNSSLSILTPKDSSFRIFNWSLAYSDGTHHYECLILTQKEDGNTSITFLKSDTVELKDQGLDQITLDSKHWVQGLYYKIIETETKFQKYYTLLSWDGNDLLSNKKCIEVLWFDKGGNLKFGAPIFKSNRDTFSRVIFEFGGQQSMMLKYESNLNRITFDHLSPPNSSLEGIYEYYGADFTYDTYQWEGKYWKLVSEVFPESADPKKRTETKVTDERFSKDDTYHKKNVKKNKSFIAPKTD